MRYDTLWWACLGGIIGFILASQAVVYFAGPGGLLPDDRVASAYGMYLGLPAGAYLGWRAGPSVVTWLKGLLQRH